ncbi:SulP family inorganic anion transporter [Flammeovirga kamogawensis]|uniref:Sulfate permease n=1 Tax=Flammeovirga kamogawensis TaxID=373891 RepID=A0ABX8GV38_9BACT|nr:sulfate permease [Flammeovirga kamogawensis]MBB6459663.1 SulP family sulfate permease [Flammeovirga kamogawensis]QWG07274.1 sulfate permease [Flammeovirga kamogawensis]TRX69094.1 sulfate permease [Flammeovirga kamogawensis]
MGAIQEKLPFLSLIKNYKKAFLTGDLSAGFATGVLLIPQGMAYAVIAGVPVEYGLYASLMAPLLYFFFGSSNKLVIGPAALDSMLLASGMAGIGIALTETAYVEHVLIIVFLAGIFQFIAGNIKLGFIANFFSEPLLKGFTTAAALLIGFSQFKHVLGIDHESSNYFHKNIINMINNWDQFDLLTFGLGTSTILMILLLKRFDLSKISTPIVVVIGITLSIVFNLEEFGISVIGTIPKGLPSFQLLDFSSVNLLEIIPVALVVAIIGFTVSNSISKSVDEPGSKTNPNQEFIALGIANAVGALFGGYQASSSFSRTAINSESGANTRASNLVSTVMIALVLLFMTHVFYYLPKAVLGGIIIAATPSLFSFNYFKNIYFLKKREFVVVIITFLTTIEFGVIIGLTAGLSASVAVFMYHSLYPHMAVLGKIEGTHIHRNILRFESAKEKDGVLILRIDAPLYFSNIKFVIDTIKELVDERNNITSIIIKSESINYIDVTALTELKLFIGKANKKGIEVYMVTVVGPVRDLLFKTSIVDTLGGKQLFVHLYDVMQYIDDKESYRYTNKDIANQGNIEERD